MAKADQDLPSQIAASLSATIHRSSRSVEQLAAALAERLGTAVSAAVLRHCCAQSHPHRWPLEWTAAWVKETGDYSLVELLMDAVGLPKPDPVNAELIQFARKKLEAELAEAEAAAHRARIFRKAVGE